MYQTASQQLGNERGNLLVTTVLILFGVSVIGSGLALMSSTELKISGNQRTNATALYVAEAGLNEAIHRISLDYPTHASVGGWTGNAAIRDLKNPPDPDWETRVYLTSPKAAPVVGGSVVTTGTLQDLSGSHLQYSAAKGTDGVMTVRHKWKDLDKDGIREPGEIVLWDPDAIPSANFKSGTPIEVVTVTGVHGGSRRTIEAEIVRGLVAPGSGTSNAMAAVFSNGAISCQSNYGFCGFNHDINIAAGTVPAACATNHLGDGHVPGVSNTGSARIRVDTPGRIVGFPAPTDNNGKPYLSCAEILGLSAVEWDVMISKAGHTSMSSDMRGICYIDGDVALKSDVTGNGLLYITEELVIDGAQLHWTGLVYVGENGGGIDVKHGSEVWVLGGMVAAGDISWEGSDMVDEGVLYCADAISGITGGPNAAKSDGSVTVLSWREL